MLIDTDGEIFDKLLSYISYHSLSDLLIELMQVNILYQPDSMLSRINDDGDEEDRQKPATPEMTPEQK